MTAVNVSRRPATLDAYLSQVVTPTLERLKREGAVAIKYEAAYLRSLNFTRGDKAVADRAYARYTNAGVPTDAEYTAIQDVIFHYIAVEAGRLGLPVHIHTGLWLRRLLRARGCESAAARAGPRRRVAAQDQVRAAARRRRSVLAGDRAAPHEAERLHGFLRADVASADARARAHDSLLARVVSGEGAVRHGSLARRVRPIDWEEIGWQTTTSARDALAIALTGMMNDGEITRPRALEIAQMVMRGNALRLYGWPDR